MNKLLTAGMLLSLMLLSGCLGQQSGMWRWEHPDSGYAERNHQDDMEGCEQEAIDLIIDGPFWPGNARPYGGWGGDFAFEFCMQQRGWQLVYPETGPAQTEKTLLDPRN